MIFIGKYLCVFDMSLSSKMRNWVENAFAGENSVQIFLTVFLTHLGDLEKQMLPFLVCGLNAKQQNYNRPQHNSFLTLPLMLCYTAGLQAWKHSSERKPKVANAFRSLIPIFRKDLCTHEIMFHYLYMRVRDFMAQGFFLVGVKWPKHL